MNASPFTSFKDFSEATGAIYTFADRPMVAAVCLILAVGIVVWFIIASYTIKH